MFLYLWTVVGIVQAVLADSPTATTVNGTYRGQHLTTWDQDAFLGVPFAQPPTGSLRWRWPQSLNESFTDIRDATQQGYSCMQYRGNFSMSEDCLNLNVVRPAGNYSKPLPVLVWIFGGGLYTGSVADPQYNLSGIVKVSQDMSQPIIAVAMNYRLNMYGFMQTPQLLAEGSSNAGLLDQRMALRWIQENIEAFGGDPDRVVVWGESAGAQSIAYQMFSYGGRDDGLYRAAIMESGGPTGAQVQNLAYYTSPVENLTRTVGCWNATDQLACLRDLSQEALFAAQPSQVWNPLIDGDFLTAYPSQQMAAGDFVKVPLLTGENTDEGINFRPVMPKPDTALDLQHAFASWRSYSLSPPTIRRLLELYPDDPCTAPPYAVTNCSRFETTLDRGLQWRRGATIGGDLVMISGRRKMCELYSSPIADSQPVFSYRFNQRLWNRNETEGVQHFDNVAFSFQNISGLLGSSPEFDPHAKLARKIGEAYVRFVNNLDPNPRRAVEGYSHGTNGTNGTGSLPLWPKYDVERPRNMVLNAERCYVEDDSYRKEGIAFINSPAVARELLA
jgi:carboxylesterase type B